MSSVLGREMQQPLYSSFWEGDMGLALCLPGGLHNVGATPHVASLKRRGAEGSGLLTYVHVCSAELPVLYP